MRLILSWVVGIALLFFGIWFEMYITKVLGVVSYVEYAETITVNHGRYYETEEDGHRTNIGMFFLYLTFLIAIRGGMAVNTGKINAGFSKTDNFKLFMIGIGLLLYGIVGQIIFYIFNWTGVVVNLLNLGLGLAIGYLCYKFYIIIIERTENFKN